MGPGAILTTVGDDMFNGFHRFHQMVTIVVSMLCRLGDLHSYCDGKNK